MSQILKSKNFFRALFGLIVGALVYVASASFALPGMGSAQPGDVADMNVSPQIFSKVGFDQKLNAQVPGELTFRNEQGKVVRLRDFFGDKPTVLGLVYYGCPNLCSLSIRGLLRSLKANSLSLGRDYRTVLVSIDPEEDATYAGEQKTRFLKEIPVNGAESGLSFLTGEPKNIRALANAVGFRYQYDAQSGQYAHSAGIMILTPDGKISRYLFGIEYPKKDLKLGLVEASGGKVGSPVDQFLLFCYHYDPAQGKYGLFILNIVRVVGGLFALLLGGFVYSMIRSNRRKVLQVS